jgi:hypothetical protein
MSAVDYLRPEPIYLPQASAPGPANKAEFILNEVLSEFRPEEPISRANDPLVRSVETSTELLLWQLAKLDKMHRKALDEILHAECALSTELGRLHQFGAEFVSAVDPRGAQIKDRMAQLEEKKRRLEMDFFDRQCQCLEKLVGLVDRHKLLTPPSNP